jgi:hypothetical protein
MLYRRGDETAVIDSIARARRGDSPQRQRSLVLSSRMPIAWRGLRPAMSLEEVLAPGLRTGAVHLAGRDPLGSGREVGWDEIERAVVSGGEQAPLDAALAPAREWLFEGGRGLVRLERRRRFAVTMRGRAIAGELDRVWLAAGPQTQARALIGVPDRARADVARHAAARALGLPDVAVAALVREPELELVTAATRVDP